MSRPSLVWWEYGVAFSPVVLALVGGAVGLAVGAAAAAANLALTRGLRRTALASMSLVVTGGSFLVWAALVVALR